MMGSDFSDFLRQVPAGMIACLCMSGMLLLFSLSYIVFVRTRRGKTPSAPAAEPVKNDSFVSAPSSAPTYDTGELPDLDVLLNLPTAPPPPVAPSRPVKPGTYGVKLADTGESVQAAEVMVIMRDMDEGRLIIQIGDQTYSNLSNFPDSKNRFLKVMKELAGIVTPRPGSTPSTSETPSTTETTSATEASEPAKADAPSGLLSRLAENKGEETTTMGELLSAPSEPKKVAPSVTPPPLPDGSMPGDLPKFQLGELPLAPRRGPGFLRMNKDQERELKKPIPELNIAQAIQDYLQYKLRHTPEYAGRSINVSQASHGGVRIEVDGTFYEAVGDVEDQEIRAFLTATIEEWQSRQ